MKRTESNGSEGNLNAFLDQGSSFEGKLTFKGSVRIDGEFRGEVQSSDLLYVGESGQIEGTIRVGEAIVSGRVTGHLVAERRLQLHATAQIDGEISTAKLVVDEGARVDGRIQMGGSPDRRDKAQLETAVQDTLDGGSRAS